MRLGYGMAGMMVAAGMAASAHAQTGAAPAGHGGVKTMFDRVDTNRDGFITKAETDAARVATRARMEASARARRDRAFARLDANKDGSVTRGEFDAAPRIAQMDGPRGRRDMRRDRSGIAGDRAFTRLDTDRDGRVSLAEAEAAADRRYARRGDRQAPGRGRASPPSGRAPDRPPADRPLGGGRN